jgi:hypothetical protein
MKRDESKILFRLLTIWLAFVALIVFCSFLNKWDNVSAHQWVNVCIYFFLFLITVSLSIRDSYNRDIFINLSLVFLFHGLSFVTSFFGNGYLIGNDYTMYYAFTARKLLLSLLVNFAVIYIGLKYFFTDKKPVWLYLITLMLVVPVFILSYLPYLRDPGLIFSLQDAFLPDITRRVFRLELFGFGFIILYGYRLYRTDKMLGTYMNGLMATFFIFFSTDILGLLSKIYGFQIPSISNYVLTTNLLFMSIILFKKLLFQCTEFGLFYEHLIHKNIPMGKVRIKRYKSTTNSLLIRVIKLYLSQRRGYIFMLVFITALGLTYFRFPAFFTMNIIAFIALLVFLFLFITALYKRRSRNKYVI